MGADAESRPSESNEKDANPSQASEPDTKDGGTWEGLLKFCKALVAFFDGIGRIGTALLTALTVSIAFAALMVSHRPPLSGTLALPSAGIGTPGRPPAESVPSMPPDSATSSISASPSSNFTTTQPGATQSKQPASQPSLPPHPSCFDGVFNSIPAERIIQLTTNGGAWTRAGLAYWSNLVGVGGEYGFLLTDQGKNAAIRVSIDSINQQFTIEKAIDDSCQDIQMMPATVPLSSNINFNLVYLYTEYLGFRTEEGDNRYWLETSYSSSLQNTRR